MATLKGAEILLGLDAGYWHERDTRIERWGGKKMDAWANTPLEQIPDSEVRRCQANFTLYSRMMGQGSREYIWEALKTRLNAHMLDTAALADEHYTLLDAGAGNGRVAKKLAPLLRETFPGQTELILAERSAPALTDAHHFFATQDGYLPSSSDASKRFATLFHLNGDAVRFLHEDLTDLSLPDQSVDAVACVMVLHHQKSAEMVQTLAEFERILKPEGMAVIVDTGALPARGWRRFVVPWIIRQAISPEKMFKRDKKAGMQTHPDVALGYRDFGERDGLLAFDFAVDPTHWRQLMDHSALGKYLTEVAPVTSPNPFAARVFPALNLAVAVKR